MNPNMIHLKYQDIALRSALPSDAKRLVAWWRDGAVMAHAGFPHGIEVDEHDLVKRLEKQSSNSNAHNHLFIIMFSNNPIGEMNVNYREYEAEIGIKICEAIHQNRGLGRQALKCLIAFLFETKAIDRIVLDTNLANKRAQHVYESLGFVSTGVRYQAFTNQLGVKQDVIDYALNREQYLRLDWRIPNNDI